MKQAPKLEILPIDTLTPYANNARTHSDDQIKKIQASLREFGFVNPVLIDANRGIIAGHGRIEAAKREGMTEVPCVFVEHLTDAQKRAYILADNRLAELAGWDMDAVRIEIERLAEDGFGIEITGFEFDDIPMGKIAEDDFDADAVADAIVEPVTKLGDIWTLGRHRLMCGDSTDRATVDRLMDGQKADVTFTSPPYNANAKTGDGDIFNGKKAKQMYTGEYKDDMESDEYIKFVQTVLGICFENTEGFIFWNVSYNAKSKYEYIKQIEPFVEKLVEQICWKKSNTIPFKGMLKRAWEPIYVFSTSGDNLAVDEVTSNLWEISNVNAQLDCHKACFPVELPQKGIALVRPNTGVCLDPFGGSGSTLIACEQLNRTCYMMELDPKYCDVIIKRWETLTGQKAVLLNG